jgi:hypothetical protein
MSLFLLNHSPHFLVAKETLKIRINIAKQPQDFSGQLTCYFHNYFYTASKAMIEHIKNI